MYDTYTVATEKKKKHGSIGAECYSIAIKINGNTNG